MVEKRTFKAAPQRQILHLNANSIGGEIFLDAVHFRIGMDTYNLWHNGAGFHSLMPHNGCDNNFLW